MKNTLLNGDFSEVLYATISCRHSSSTQSISLKLKMFMISSHRLDLVIIKLFLVLSLQKNGVVLTCQQCGKKCHVNNYWRCSKQHVKKIFFFDMLILSCQEFLMWHFTTSRILDVSFCHFKNSWRGILPHQKFLTWHFPTSKIDMALCHIKNFWRGILPCQKLLTWKKCHVKNFEN